jgi:hypothetical protein
MLTKIGFQARPLDARGLRIGSRRAEAGTAAGDYFAVADSVRSTDSLHTLGALTAPRRVQRFRRPLYTSIDRIATRTGAHRFVWR